jgi:phosphate transport system protein
MPERAHFDRQLLALQRNVEQLAEMVKGSIENSLKALRTHDLELAKKVDQYDSEINAHRFMIEEETYQILALQQPVGHDMRFLVATLSIVSNLERIGDYAAGIARLVLRLDDQGICLPVAEFERMSGILQTMLGNAIQAYSRQDQPIAEAVIHQDVEVDAIHHAIYDQLMAQMSSNAAVAQPGTYSLWIAHNLERMGDRCANICERVNYVVTGELVDGQRPKAHA